MDFSNRGEHRPVQQNTHTPQSVGGAPRSSKSSRFKGSSWAKWANVVFVGALVVLVIAVALSVAFAKDNSAKESTFVKRDKFQAVFLNGGQVYFGKITDLNSRNLRISNIYYLRVNQQVQPDQANANNANDISLVKLGCELHGPEDSMVVNREQVIFWENLKSDGQVTKAIDEYVKANPDGQKCDQQQNTGNTNPNTNNNSNTGSNTSNTTNNNTNNNSND